MLGRPGLNFPNSDALEITGPRSDGADEAVAAAECDALDAVSPRAGAGAASQPSSPLTAPLLDASSAPGILDVPFDSTSVRLCLCVCVCVCVRMSSAVRCVGMPVRMEQDQCAPGPGKS